VALILVEVEIGEVVRARSPAPTSGMES